MSAGDGPGDRDDKGRAGGRAPKFRRRAGARPDEVLDAALALFIEKGFAATRVEDIARRAGVSKGTVYLYFPSKEEILEALVRRAVVPIASDALETAASFSGDPRIVIGTVMRLLANRLAEPGLLAIPKLIMREMTHLPQLAVMYRREVLDRMMPVVEGLVRRGIAEGYLKSVDPELTIRSIVGPVMLHLLLAELFSVTPADGLALERLIDNHLAILFEGLSARPGGAP
jgi:AcrR family transcriptional regulator